MSFQKSFDLIQSDQSKEIIFYNNIYVASNNLIEFINRYDENQCEYNIRDVAGEKLLDIQKQQENMAAVVIPDMQTEDTLMFNSFIGNLILDEETFDTKEKYLSTLNAFYYKMLEAVHAVKGDNYVFNDITEEMLDSIKQKSNPMDYEVAEKMLSEVIKSLEERLSK